MLIDLSAKLDNKTPHYPGDPPFTLTKIQEIRDSGYRLHTIESGTHAGTHVDAPSHMIDSGVNASELNLTIFTGQAICIDARLGFDESMLKKIDFKECNIVIFNTGTHSRYYEPSYFTDYPAISESIARFLVDNGAKLVGLDTCSADNTPNFLVHKILLENNIPIIENLTNLDAVTDKSFTLYAFPLKMDTDGSPLRAVAEVKT